MDTDKESKTLKQLLMTAPPGQIDDSMKVLIDKWDEPVKAIQVLEVLDKCVRYSLASSFAIVLLEMIYNDALANESLKHEDVVKQATWR